MKEYEAINLLEKTFGNNFDLNNFTYFLKELLKNKFNIQNKSPSVASEFEDYIKSFRKIGEYRAKNGDFEILAVELKKVDSLERARTMQRNFVAKWLNNSNYPKDGALVAFYGENPEDWRFSFVKMDYKLAEDGKISKELTPAKRHSFLVGKNEPNHTCKRQFLNLLLEEEIPPSIEDLEKAFSVENVTKEFFEEYKKRFLELKESLDEILKKDKLVYEEFEKKGINSVEFSKKLLGQIIFLYFLQKKGWLGVKKNNSKEFDKWGTGPKDFMKKLFKKEITSYNNFFNEILEPLFYEALAKERDENYYSRFKCKIPFLNGGLFEPLGDYDWTKTDILIDNSIFKKIFDTFDEFNFTIKEDEPLEKEVAVDPEMLGKVFENLLEVIDRKSKGAFYTPREIVHYMCQQSLINYLGTNTEELNISRKNLETFILKGDIYLDQLRRLHLGKGVDKNLILPKNISDNYEFLDNLLKEIKICDPAVGSGAFLVGMMNEIIKARNILTYFFVTSKRNERKDYNLKRETIENSLYGVDIEASAVEITKLRFWLSLIVDELDMENIKPLPNLDNKIMCGNSLIEEFEGIKLYKEPTDKVTIKQVALDQFVFQKKKESELKLKELRDLQSQFFNEQSRNVKNQLRKMIDKIEWEFIEETLKEQNKQEAIRRLEEIKKSQSKPFFLWKLYFSDVFDRKNPGFDIVIANPPYIRDEEIMDLKEQLNKSYVVFSGNSDIYTYFYERGIFLLREQGNLAFISSNKFMRAKYGIKLRNFLKTNSSFIEIIDFGSTHLFDAITNTLILILKKENNHIIKNNFYFRKNLEEEPIIFLQENLSDDAWSIFDKERVILKEKIEKNGTFLSELDIKINYGLISGFNEAFVITKEERDELIKRSKNNEKIIKPLIRGRDIGRYYYRSKDLYLIVIPSGFTKKISRKDNLSEEEAKRVIDKEFPGITAYMKNIQNLFEKGEIKAKGKGLYTRDNMGEYWWELRDCTYYEDFKKEKIIWIELSDKNKFAYSNYEDYILAGGFLMTGKYLKFLLSFLNSKVCLFYFNLICNSSGMNTTQWKKFVMDKVPIPKISEKDQKPFIEIVDRILSITGDRDYLKDTEKQAMVKALEKKIDKMVYELYGLTFEEIKIVEEFEK